MSRGYQGRGMYDRRESYPIINEMKQTVESKSTFAEIPADTLVTWGQKIADLISEVKAHQVRRIFSEIKQLENSVKSGKVGAAKEIQERLIFLKPLLMYTENRDNKIRPLREALEIAINKISKEEESSVRNSFLRFVKFVEAIVAYHRGR